jgi:hypothetical protein
MIPIYFHSIDRIHEPPFVVNHELIQIIVIIPVPQLPSVIIFKIETSSVIGPSNAA